MPSNRKRKLTLIHIVVYFFARIIFYALGWKKKGDLPPNKKFVLIFAPHTSYTDNYMLAAIQALYHFEGYWLAAEKLFKNPILRAFNLWAGARPVYRDESNNLVDQYAQQFRECDEMILGLAPKGTRKKRPHWKSGFYWIAYEADVPIVCLGMDYKRKELSIGPVIEPCGDIYADMAVIRAFYNGMEGRHPERMSPFEVSPDIDVSLYQQRKAS